MIEYALVFFFIIFILVNEKILKFYHIKFCYDNYNFIKFIVKNCLYALPLITIYFNYENIISNINKKKKRNLNNTTKKLVASNQQWRCNMCNILLDASYEIDHKIPLYKNGTNEIHNLQALCRNCHGKKTIFDKLN